MKFNADIDIDLSDRTELLKHIEHTPASIIKDAVSKHNTGVYLQDIPYDPINDCAAIDYKEAEDLGFIKIDVINNHSYDDINNPDDIDLYLNMVPDWGLFRNEDVVKTLPHIHNHFDIVSKHLPNSIDHLAMILALIRPAKRYLIGKSWEEIEAKIWLNEGNGYHFKKSHSYSYAYLIILKLNQYASQK